MHSNIVEKVCALSNEIIISIGYDARIVIWTKGKEDNWGNCAKNSIEKAHEGPICDLAITKFKMFTVGKDSKINIWF